MQVIDNREKESIPFYEIEVSEEFMYTGRLHIRTNDSIFNAVDLLTGELRTIDDHENVGMVSAIITIQP